MVKHIQQFEITFLHLTIWLELDVTDGLRCGMDRESVRQIRPKQVLVRLVVNQFSLHFRAFLSRELPAARGVPDRNFGCIQQIEGAAEGDLKASLNHDLVDNSRVGFHLKLALLGDLDEPREQILARNPNLVKTEVTIVNAAVA